MERFGLLGCGHWYRCSCFRCQPRLPALLRQTLGFGTLVGRMCRLQLLALQRACPRFDFGIGAGAFTRCNLGCSFRALAFLFGLDQAFKLRSMFPRRTFGGTFGGTAQLCLPGCRMFRGIFIKYLFLLFFLQTYTFGGLC